MGLSLHYDPGDAPGRSARRTYLIVCLLFIVLPFILEYETPSESLEIAGIPLPATCASRRCFDADCPGCGLTRSFVCLAHGEARQALRLHRLGPFLYLFFGALAALHAWSLFRPEARPPEAFDRAAHYAGWLVTGALILNWVAGVLLKTGNGS